MSNQNLKHHENRGKVYGRSRLRIERCQCDIIMQVNGAVEFKNHIFVRNLHENYAQLTLQANVFCGSGSQIRFACVELIKLFFLFIPRKSRMSPLKSTPPLSSNSMSPSLASLPKFNTTVGFQVPSHPQVNGAVGLDTSPQLKVKFN